MFATSSSPWTWRSRSRSIGFVVAAAVATTCGGDAICSSPTDPGCRTDNEPSVLLAPQLGPTIGVDVPSIAWSFVDGDVTPRMKRIVVTNSGWGTLTGLAASVSHVTGGAGWLTVALSSSDVPPDAWMDVTVAPGGLAIGKHVAEIRISSPVAHNDVEIRVVIDVSAGPVGGPPAISVSVPSISWSIVKGDLGRVTRTTSLWITNAGGGTLTGLATSVAYVGPTSGWVSTWMGRPVAQGVRMTVNLSAFDLPVGEHVAELTLSSPVAGNSVEIRIVVDVRPGPDLPSNLTVTNAGMVVTLGWTDNSDDEDEFRIERRVVPSGEWSEIKEVPANTTSLDDVVPAPDWYAYRVRACSALGCSGYVYRNHSNIPVPAAPTMEVRPTRVPSVVVNLGSTSPPQTAWLVNTGEVPLHWMIRNLPWLPPMTLKTSVYGGIIPPHDSVGVVMTVTAPSTWPSPPLPTEFETGVVLNEAISYGAGFREFGGIGLKVTVH